MRVGILTFFRNPNYGAMLQAYALWQFLSARGNEVEFIDYNFGNATKPSLFYCVVSKCLRTLRFKWKQRIDFDITHFSDSFPRTKEVFDSDGLVRIAEGFDALVVGSDQVWNPNGVAREHVRSVFLSEIPDGIRKIAYAPSFSVPCWPDSFEADLVARSLTRFDALSVRESQGADIVHALCGRQPELVVDPTLLWSRSFYEDILPGNSLPAEGCLLNFLIRDWTSGTRENEIIAELSRSLGCELIKNDSDISTPMTSLMGTVLRLQKRIGVPEWLRRVRDSKFVLTNSFHGTVFSLLFHRPFLCVSLAGKHAAMNCRIESLLEVVGLGDRLVDPETPLSQIVEKAYATIDWNEVDSRIDRLRQKSIRFLHEALK